MDSSGIRWILGVSGGTCGGVYSPLLPYQEKHMTFILNNSPTMRIAGHSANFYDELFNYCFPVNYQMQVQRNLAHGYQNDKSVVEYTYKLTELFNMIGDISEHDQVLKFWNGS